MEINKKNIPIFILCGKARSGKDTVSSYIKEFFDKKDKKAITLAYAFYIKEYAKRISNWDGSDETKPRDLLNTIGTEVVRKNIDDMFFVKRTIEDIDVFSYFFDVAIISDARFPIEITTLKEKYKNVYSIHIIRPNYDDGLSDSQRKHAVETSLDNYDSYDYEIINDGSLDDLNEKVCKLMEEIDNEC